jgi:hypothetical protein
VYKVDRQILSVLSLVPTKNNGFIAALRYSNSSVNIYDIRKHPLAKKDFA